ncbi:hypothetical protein PITC_039020 [Penicillium italicum]|uniref:Uncharacterized protein n=1 Tax=Penicillium italicum TaxID=40296 RepID=A0A0A2L3H0_PENIT|nr:hypothetical protein PITC_039020 [Penicillium italicum]
MPKPDSSLPVKLLPIQLAPDVSILDSFACGVAYQNSSTGHGERSSRSLGDGTHARRSCFS